MITKTGTLPLTEHPALAEILKRYEGRVENGTVVFPEFLSNKHKNPMFGVTTFTETHKRWNERQG